MSSWTFGLLSVSLRRSWLWACLGGTWEDRMASAMSRLVATSWVPIGSKGDVAVSTSVSKAEVVPNSHAIVL